MIQNYLIVNIAQSWGITFLMVNLFFLFYLYSKKISVIDLFWGPLHFLQLFFCLYFGLNRSSIALSLYLGLVFVWSLRLTIYLYVRSIGAPDDPRYLKLAKNWKGNLALNVLLRIFYIQFIISLITSSTLILTITSRTEISFGWVNIFGFVLSIFGLMYESLADFQLYRFKKNKVNKGKVMNFGLWKFSRHPNYFGEILFWWGIWISSYETNYWGFGIISPLTITYLLTRFSGVPMLEERYKNNPEYLAYIRKTNTLIPGRKVDE